MTDQLLSGVILAAVSGGTALITVFVQERLRKQSAESTADVTAEIARITHASNERISENTSRAERIEALEQRLDALMQRVSTLSDENARLAGHDAFQDLEISRLTQENAALTVEIQLLQEQNRLLRAELDTVKQERDTYKASLDELRTKFAQFSPRT